jgi:diaminohydroxyphosphoribosylaminopyrimidine deaminase/5-amino-6-(5-phosphoribosylamino)uracil reductase
MERALELARQSIGLASPNPAVGCVLVRDGKAVGEGFHEYDNKDHAEIAALRTAGDAARGATAYVTLEPCSHTGRTGPCADALIAAGVARVVVATSDPNPAVGGKGIERLRAARIGIEAGLMCEEARQINDGFARYIRTKLPLVTLKAGMTLDGRIAPAPGSHPAGTAFLITGEESHAEAQQMRHAVDAVITGINTVLTDNPLLTDRSGLPRRRPLLRVVLDSGLRLPLDSQLVRTANQDVVAFCTTAHHRRVQSLEVLGVRIEQVGSDGGTHLSLQAVLKRLGELQITSVLLEAGAQLNTAFLNEQLVDKLCLFCAPRLLGSAAVPVVSGLTAERRMTGMKISRFGEDFCVEGYLRNVWPTGSK